MNDDVISSFVDASSANLLKHDMRRIPGDVPDEMLDETVENDDDWIGWRPISSTVTDSDLVELQEITVMPFPPAYRVFLKYQHFLGLSEIGVRFKAHPCHSWKADLLELYKIEPVDRIMGIGLIPFGDESFMDAGPVCFDTRHAMADGDYPVVFWDHEWKGTDREIHPMFSSSMKMFECLHFAVQTEIDFIYDDGDESIQVLQHKKDLMSQFLAIDPEGAGGPARGYWTCWGVNPDE